MTTPRPQPRNRPHVMLTLDPRMHQEAQRMAADAGLPLSRYVEQLIRAELERKRRRSR